VNVSDETAAGPLTLTARPPAALRRVRFDPTMKTPLDQPLPIYASTKNWKE